MNKSQQTLHDLMLSILPFEEFRQNDVVETIIFQERFPILNIDEERETMFNASGEVKTCLKDWSTSPILNNGIALASSQAEMLPSGW